MWVGQPLLEPSYNRTLLPGPFKTPRLALTCPLRELWLSTVQAAPLVQSLA